MVIFLEKLCIEIFYFIGFSDYKFTGHVGTLVASTYMRRDVGSQQS